MPCPTRETGREKGPDMDDALAEQWRTQGYIVVRGLFDPDRCRRLLAIAESALEQWRRSNPETGEPGGGSQCDGDAAPQSPELLCVVRAEGSL